ncbi:MAG: PilZ domain-containing protein [Elusimicrobiota bacterium]
MMVKKERRKQKRLPLTLSIARPMRLELHSEYHDELIPGILANLSASGMALIAFHSIPQDSMIELDMEFMHVSERIRGKIVREEKKFDDVYLVGVEFEKRSEQLKEVVEQMAEDHDICDLRFVVNPETACFPKCSFRPLCGRRIKKDFNKKGEK